MNKYLEGLTDEQKAAVMQTKGNIRLIAGAGSGKTKALATRVAYICETENVSPEKILCVTFTNKAAEEMKNRISSMLNTPEENLSVMTFHRLALNICEKHLSKAGYPTREEDGETVADILIGSTPVNALADGFFKAHGDALKGLGGEEQEMFKNAVIRYAKSIIKGHDYAGMLGNETETVLPAPSEVLSYESERDTRNKEIEKRKREISKIRTDLKKDYGKNHETYEKLAKIKAMEKEIFRIKSVRTGSSPVKPWAVSLIRGKMKSKVMDFDDIIMYALHLLKNYEDVRNFWQEKFEYVQVDEFQDTDYAQLETLKLLTEKSGNLFVVGDPDQSIYQFRGVKPEVFNTLDTKLKDLKTLYMVNNFRSAPGIVAGGNGIISLNKNRIKKESVAMSNDKDVPVFITGTDSHSTAEYILSQIRQMLRQGVNPDDIAVLYRDKNCAVTDELTGLLCNSGIKTDSQYEKNSYPESFREIVMNVLKYGHTGNMNFLGNFIEAFFGEDYTGVFNPVILDTDSDYMTDPEVMFKLLEFYHPKRFTKAGMPTGKYKKFTDEAEKVKAVVKETVEEWNGLTGEEKTALCNEDVLVSGERDLGDGIHIMTMHKSKGLEFDYVFVILDNGLCPKTGNFTTFDSLEEDVRLAYVAVTRAKKRVYLCSHDKSSVSPFITAFCQGLSDTGIKAGCPKSLKLSDITGNTAGIEEFNNLLDMYWTINHEGVYVLKSGNRIVGYRYVTVINGEKIFFEGTVKDIIDAGIVVDERYAEGIVEVGEDYDFSSENGRTAVVIEKNILTSLFDGKGTPLAALKARGLL